MKFNQTEFKILRQRLCQVSILLICFTLPLFAKHPKSSGLTDSESIKLLNFYWEADKYQEYLSTAQVLPDTIRHSEGGLTDLRCGYILVRLHQDLQSAKDHFIQCYTINGKYKTEARAAADWIDLLIAANDEEISVDELDNRFKAFIAKTQGGVEKEINALSLARRTWQYAQAIQKSSPEAADKLYRSLLKDPVFGKWAKEASLSHAKMTGQGISEAEASLSRENSVEQMQSELLAAARNNEYEKAYKLLDSITNDFPECYQTCEARLTRGYLLFRQERVDEAIAAFELAIQENTHLGDSHPFNLEAKARLKYTYQAKSYGYGAESGVSANTDTNEMLARAESSLVSSQAYLNALPEYSNEEPQALLDACGAVFESLQRRKWANDPVTAEDWESLNESLVTVSNHPSISKGQKAIADLMLIETSSWEGNYSETIRIGNAFLENYSPSDDQFKTVAGTALSFLVRANQIVGDLEASVDTGYQLLSMYEEEDVIWENMDHIERAYHDIYVSLRLMGKTREDDAGQLLEEFRQRFPESSYIEAISYNENANLYGKQHLELVEKGVLK